MRPTSVFDVSWTNMFDCWRRLYLYPAIALACLFNDLFPFLIRLIARLSFPGQFWLGGAAQPRLYCELTSSSPTAAFDTNVNNICTFAVDRKLLIIMNPLPFYVVQTDRIAPMD